MCSPRSDFISETALHKAAQVLKYNPPGLLPCATGLAIGQTLVQARSKSNMEGAFVTVRKLLSL